MVMAVMKQSVTAIHTNTLNVPVDSASINRIAAI